MDKDLDYFINLDSIKIFDSFKLESDFLECHPSEWSQNDNYNKALNVFKKMKVVNDCAERAIKLMQDYRGLFTKDLKQYQCMLQIINNSRETHPSATKELNVK